MGVIPALVMAAALTVAAPSPVEFDLTRNGLPLEDVVTAIDRACADSRRVPVHLDTAGGRVDVRFECQRIQADRPAAIRAELLHRVEDFRDARERAERVIAIERALPGSDHVGYDRDGMVWSYATYGVQRCTHPLRPKTIREWMHGAAVSSWETPERWTMIEAIPLAGACPEQLDDFFRNVRRAGEPAAARAVQRRIERALRAT